MTNMNAKSYALKVTKPVFAFVIGVVNIVSAYVVPYGVDHFVSDPLWSMVSKVLITLGLNGLVVYLSIEENNAPTQEVH